MRIVVQSISVLRVGPDDPVVESEVVVHDELVHHLEVAGVLREVLVKLWGGGSHFRQVVPRYAREVVMLDMVPDIQPRDIHPADVVVSLQLVHVFVMLGEDVKSCGMRTYRQEGAYQEVCQSPTAHELVNESVCEYDRDDVDYFVLVHGLEEVEHRSQRINKGCHECPDSFAYGGVDILGFSFLHQPYFVPEEDQDPS